MRTIEELVRRETRHYKKWCNIFMGLSLLLIGMSAAYESRWEFDERKLNAPEYKNCQATLKQCNIVNGEREKICPIMK